jgi:hypothetical protein
LPVSGAGGGSGHVAEKSGSFGGVTQPASAIMTTTAVTPNFFRAANMLISD